MHFLIPTLLISLLASSSTALPLLSERDVITKTVNGKTVYLPGALMQKNTNNPPAKTASDLTGLFIIEPADAPKPLWSTGKAPANSPPQQAYYTAKISFMGSDVEEHAAKIHKFMKDNDVVPTEGEKAAGGKISGVKKAAVTKLRFLDLLKNRCTRFVQDELKGAFHVLDESKQATAAAGGGGGAGGGAGGEGQRQDKEGHQGKE